MLAAAFAAAPALCAQVSAQPKLIPKNVNLKTSGNWKAGVIRRGPNGKLYLASPGTDAGGKPPQEIVGPAVHLHWSAPRVRADGKPLKYLRGYRVLWGTQPGRYSHAIKIGMRTSYTLKGLTPGTVYFIAVTAYLPNGIESTPSNVLKIVIRKPSASP